MTNTATLDTIRSAPLGSDEILDAVEAGLDRGLEAEIDAALTEREEGLGAEQEEGPEGAWRPSLSPKLWERPTQPRQFAGVVSEDYRMDAD